MDRDDEKYGYKREGEKKGFHWFTEEWFGEKDWEKEMSGDFILKSFKNRLNV